jgi:hypothetical protein
VSMRMLMPGFGNYSLRLGEEDKLHERRLFGHSEFDRDKQRR